MLVEYNCFFAESRQAKSHRHDFTLHAVCKKRMWVSAGSFLERGECVFSRKRGGKLVLENAVNIQDIWMFAVRCLPSISNCHEYNLVSRFIINFCIFLCYNFFHVFIQQWRMKKIIDLFYKAKHLVKIGKH